MGDEESERARRLEVGRWLVAQECDFTFGATMESNLPPPGLPEVAFAGRSNVGKSSLVNALTGRRTLARVSARPGHTRQINFFDLAGRLFLVDLPGYGFAKASKGETKRFQNLGRDYLRGRPNLRRVFLLIDARHGLKDADKPALDVLGESAVSHQIVLTKIDQVKPAELAQRTAEVEAALRLRPAAFPQVLATSAHDGVGIPELRAAIARLKAERRYAHG